MKTFAFVLLSSMIASTSYAATSNVATDVQRDANQQQRIEQGLQSGQLTTREAGQLEHKEAGIASTERRDTRNGTMSASEQQRLTARENNVSHDIYNQKHDAQTGNPNSASSQRMQHDVQRNLNQQHRIEQGTQSGTLSNREAGKLERGQAHVDRREAHDAANGHVGAEEQRGIQHAENRQSRHVFRKKHN